MGDYYVYIPSRWNILPRLLLHGIDLISATSTPHWQLCFGLWKHQGCEIGASVEINHE